MLLSEAEIKPNFASRYKEGFEEQDFPYVLFIVAFKLRFLPYDST